MKLEKGDTAVKHAKEMEEMRNERRLLQSEVERIGFKMQC